VVAPPERVCVRGAVSAAVQSTACPTRPHCPYSVAPQIGGESEEVKERKEEAGVERQREGIVIMREEAYVLYGVVFERTRYIGLPGVRMRRLHRMRPRHFTAHT